VVEWSPVARDDLRAIFGFIALDSPFYAKKVIREVIERVTAISRMPEAGRMTPETNDKSIREILVYSYRVIYQLSPEHVSVLAVVHGRRNVSADDIQPR
jgi:plasmid stabilization system protein ParE